MIERHSPWKYRNVGRKRFRIGAPQHKSTFFTCTYLLLLPTVYHGCTIISVASERQVGMPSTVDKNLPPTNEGYGTQEYW